MLLHVRQDVAVDAKRHGHIRMTEHFGDNLWVDTVAQQERGSGMAQVVKANARQLSTLEQWVERTQSYIGWMEMATDQPHPTVKRTWQK
jgi:hypothetical protein